MKFNTLGNKIGLGYGLALIMFAVVVTTTLIKVVDVERYSSTIRQQQVPGVTAALTLKAAVNRSISALRGWVAFGGSQAESDLKDSQDSIVQAFDTLILRVQNSDNFTHIQTVNNLGSELLALRGYQQEIQQIAQTPENFPGMLLLSNQAAPAADIIVELVTEMIELEVTEVSSAERKKLLKLMADLRASIASGLAAIRAYLLTDDIKFRNEFQRNWQINADRMLAIEQNRGLLRNDQQRAFTRIIHLREQFELLPQQLFAYREGGEWNKAKKQMDLNVVPLEASIRAKIDKIVQFETQVMQQAFGRIGDEFELLVNTATALWIAAMVLCSLMAFWLTRQITRPINQVVLVADSISRGNFDIATEFKGSEEAKRMSLSLANMTNMLKRIAEHASAIASGNYTSDFEPISEVDKLGHALSQMTVNLRETTRQKESQNWLISGQAGLAQELRGELQVDEIAQRAVSFLANFIDAQVGALYLNNEGTLTLAASYAFNTRRVVDTDYQIGEGLVGQVAKEKRPIFYTQVPKAHIHFSVDSGLGESYPDSILITPLINTQTEENCLIGVLVLAATKPLNEQAMGLLEKVAEAIAIAVSSAESKARLQELLEESQQQSEELQAQQEELRSANETLEAQSHSLQQSEKALREQSENLQKTNKDLGLRTDELELQKRAIEQKNQEVELASIQLEKKAKELEIASKYKSEFLANMSHELRTPLNSLLILSQALSQNSLGNLSEEQVEDAKIIYSGGKSLLTLINDILDLSKVEAGKLQLHQESVGITQLVTNLRAQFQPVANDKHLEFRVTIDADTPEAITTDGQRLEQILRNLIANAMKFTESGFVKLTISKTQPDVLFKSSHLMPETSLAFTVEDSGTGIAEDKQSEIFAAFQQADGTTSRAFGGTGLGLTISRELSSLLSGEIQLVSELGKGSCFTLYLPVTPAQAVAEAMPHDQFPQVAILSNTLQSRLDNHNLADDRDALQLHDKRILIVEDDIDFARTLQGLCRACGFKCLVTNHGKEALALVMQFEPTAVILDMGLPERGSHIVLESLRASPMTQNIPLHIISSENSDESTLKKGACVFLTKPADKRAVDEIFKKFETLFQQAIKDILLVEDDENGSNAIRRLLSDKGAVITSVSDGNAAAEALRQTSFDCCILDDSLSQTKELNWLESLRNDDSLSLPPIIIYSSREQDDDEFFNLLTLADEIAIKRDFSPDRLRAETSLFLHSLREQQGISHLDIDEGTACSVTLEGKTVLLVDDDLRNTYALSKVLKKHGLHVVIADNGELALEKLAEQRQVDLVLMDIMMPVMDGYETMRHIRRNLSDTLPIIALTAKAMTEDKAKCIQAGASDYLAKPVDIEQLVSVMKVWLYH